jgi:hypothetical protein
VNIVGYVCDLNNIKEYIKIYNKYPVISCIDYKRIAEYFQGYTQVSLGRELSEKLMAFEKSKRRYVVYEELNKIIFTNKSENLIISEIDILFNPSYDIDILRFFINASRVKNLVVIWNGQVINNELRYSENKYEDYHHYDISKFDILCLN